MKDASRRASGNLDNRSRWVRQKWERRNAREGAEEPRNNEYNNVRKKLWGTLFASPVLLCLVSSYFFFFADFFAAFFLVAMVSILPFDCSIEFATIFCCNC